MTDQSTLRRAEDFLGNAIHQIKRNAAARDQPDGERSIPRAVAAFNALEGTDLTSSQVARLMACIKLSRATGGGDFNPDDYVDATAYIGMSGEEARRESGVAAAAIKARRDAVMKSLRERAAAKRAAKDEAASQSELDKWLELAKGTYYDSAMERIKRAQFEQELAQAQPKTAPASNGHATFSESDLTDAIAYLSARAEEARREREAGQTDPPADQRNPWPPGTVVELPDEVSMHEWVQQKLNPLLENTADMARAGTTHTRPTPDASKRQAEARINTAVLTTQRDELLRDIAAIKKACDEGDIKYASTLCSFALNNGDQS